MKLNLKNKKALIAFALVFFMIAPMLFGLSTVRAAGATTGTFSAVVSGTGGTTMINSVNLPSSPNPIGTTVKFDIYISNAANIWGWSIPTITWNPAVIQLASVKEGPFLADNTGSDVTGFTGNQKPLFDNVNGLLQGGMAEAIQAADVSTDSAGVVATMTFTVVGYGNSAVTINGGNLRASSSDNTGVSAACNSASVAVIQPATTISLYQNGTQNANIQYPSLSNPIGGTFKVDMYINGATNVWGWSAGVTWNPSVLSCTSVTEGSYLSQSGATLFAPGFIDNYLGKVDAGIADAYLSYMNASASSGVLCTLTFQILSYGNSNLNITAGAPSTLLNQNVPHQAITPVTLNSATYSWTPATAINPQAVITTSGSPFGAGSNQTLTNYALTVDGSQSVAGTNMVPPYQNCPITAYSWSITLVDGTTVTANTPTVALSAAQVGMNPGTIVATLTVTAPSPTMTPAPTYSGMGTTTFSIAVLPPLPAGWNNFTNGQLDIWTQNGGQGINANATAYGPQQLVNLTGFVTYNGAPVVGKQVTFNVYVNGVYIDYRTALTNATGYATVSYRFPWQDSNPTQYFGVVTITGAVDVSQVTLNDTCNFYYGYILNLQQIQITNGIYDSNGVGPVFFRNYAGLNVVTITATVNSTNWMSQPFYLTASVYDNNSVPVATSILAETAAPAITGSTGSNTNTYTISLNIPTYAFVGPATVYVNIFNGNPAQNGLGFSPEQAASLYIYSGK